MATREAIGFDVPSRTWSLRREWSRAFTVMLVLLLVASIGTVFGVRQLVGEFSGTARQLDRETTVVAALDSALVAHEAAAHQLLNGTRVDMAVFSGQEVEISTQFHEAAALFPVGSKSATLLAVARTGWQGAMTRAGLWGGQLTTFALPTGTNPNRQVQVTLGTDSDSVQALLAGIQKPTLDVMKKGLASDAHLEWLLIRTLAALFGLALSVTVYFRRRMTKDLVRPVVRLHEGVVRLRAGEYGFRIEVVRRDELGELAEAFNDMAGDLHASHLALTLRASHDALTGLPNRAALAERLSTSFGPVGERRGRSESVLFIDIDDFKDVNDSLGHETGDALLVQLAARLNSCVRAQDLVARLGGDEFAIVVVEGPEQTTAVEVAKRILQVLRGPFTVNETLLTVTVSIGIAQRHVDTADAAELLREADFAMYMAKGRR